MRTLVNRGYVRQEPSRRYSLGSRLIRLGDTSSRLLGAWLQPYLVELVALTDETANLAMLDGDEVVYIAQAPSPHQMRMFTEPGRRVRPHCTAVGKALLSQLPPDEVRAILRPHRHAGAHVDDDHRPRCAARPPRGDPPAGLRGR